MSGEIATDIDTEERRTQGKSSFRKKKLQHTPPGGGDLVHTILLTALSQEIA